MTMGRTYERESVSAIETADIVDYLMDNYTKDQEKHKTGSRCSDRLAGECKDRR